jgi:proton translocating ATP synthase F1 alpha subunit
MVLNIEENFKKVVLFGNDRLVLPNTPVRLTGNLVKVPVGPSVLGRVLDSLGNPIDSKKPLKALGYKRIEIKAPGIIVRQPVTEPVYTGILAIDSMIPVGRGQRELIIGDRQTGKTTIAIDAILNQKSYFAKKNKKDFLYCIYVAIGQKRSSLAHIYGKLKKKSALSYSVLIGATASDPASLQYIAPYAGASIGE